MRPLVLHELIARRLRNEMTVVLLRLEMLAQASDEDPQALRAHAAAALAAATVAAKILRGERVE